MEREILMVFNGNWMAIPGHGCWTDDEFRSYQAMLERRGNKEGIHFKIEPPLDPK